jgi:hypothetical protein
MTRMRIERVLPAPGEVLVRRGEWVEPLQKIARMPARGEFRVLDVARTLGLNDYDLSQVMVKRRDDRVEAGEIIAARRGPLPFWHKPCRSPLAGRLAAVGHGWVVIEADGHPSSATGREGEPMGGKATETEELNLLAFVAGKVIDIAEKRSVSIETVGAYIQGACGVGGEANGVLQMPVTHPTDVLTADAIGLGSNNAILVGGASVSPEALERARHMQVRGIIVGGIPASLHEFMPALPFPVVATEGYGNLPLSPIIFSILKRLEGHEVSISGEMERAWDRARPVIVVPLSEPQEREGEFPIDASPTDPGQVGDRVRAVRLPLLGQVGQVVSVPAEARPVPSGFSLPGAQVAFADWEMLASQPSATSVREVNFVPWLNLERIGGGTAA